MVPDRNDQSPSFDLTDINTNPKQDAGGGTVDLIAYRIKSITPIFGSKKLEFVQVENAEEFS
jgi:hypothetical protein